MMGKPKFELPEFDGGAGVARAASPTRRLLEETKLSRLPAINRQSRTRVCVGCGKAIDQEDKVQVMFSACAACVKIYGRLDAALLETAERLKREKLAVWTGNIDF